MLYFYNVFNTLVIYQEGLLINYVHHCHQVQNIGQRIWLWQHWGDVESIEDRCGFELTHTHCANFKPFFFSPIIFIFCIIV